MSEVPKNFKTVIVDFTNDLSIVYPEYAHLWSSWKTADAAEYEKLYNHCLAVFPERFFDVMYTNVDIFKADSKQNVEFLPGVNFRVLFNCDGISENTKTSIWKYLQLILMTVLGSVKDVADFGDAADIFSAMGEKDLQDKMAETMEGINEFFSSSAKKEEDFEFNESHFQDLPKNSPKT